MTRLYSGPPGFRHMAILALMAAGFNTVELITNNLIPITCRHFTDSAFLISAILATTYGWPLWASTLAGLLVAAIIGGLVGIRDRIAYCVSKSAVVGLTRSMALDHALDGVRVNCICPGRVETPFVKARLREYPDPEVAYREMTASQPVGRMGRPEEIAAAALYLASDEAAFVTGAAFTIDGGWSAG